MSRTLVVVLNWNGRQHLRTFLPSVVRHTPPEVGIVVADNGSTDDSVAMLQRDFPSVEVLQLDRNYGFAEGYDRAVARLEADYFILLNSDVETPSGWCEPLIAALDADPRLGAVQPKVKAWSRPGYFEYAGACGGFLDRFGYPFCRGRILGEVERDEGQYDTFRHCLWASGACMACRRELFTEVGGFDAAFFAHMEEIDLCWRAQLAGYRIAVEPASVVYHLGGGTLPMGSPRKTYLNYRNNLAMLYKNLPAAQLWWVLPVRMVLDGLSAAAYLAAGRGALVRSVWQAHRDFYRQLPLLRPKREAVQRTAVATPEGIYGGSLLWRYATGRRRFGCMM